MSEGRRRWRIVHGSPTSFSFVVNAGHGDAGDSDHTLLVGDSERETALQALARAYGQGHLTREEHDRRSDLALRATSRGDLDRAFANLPLAFATGARPGSGRRTALLVCAILSLPVVLLGVILLGDERGLQENAVGLLLLGGLGLGLYGLAKWAFAARHVDDGRWRPGR